MNINVTDTQNTSLQDNPWYVAVLHTQTSLIPCVCLSGFIGNILAAGVFLSQPLRNTSCCFYLASKCISDIWFLASLIVVWLYRLDVPLFNTNGVCQATVFITYTSSFLSVWFVVLITWENFIRVSLPGHVVNLCNVRRAKFTIGLLVAISFGIYSFSLWTTGIKNNDIRCNIIEKYDTLLMAMTCVDSMLTLVIPLIIMVFLNIAIAVRGIQARERRKRLFESIPMSAVSRRRSSGIELKVTKLLFAVSTIFILLHTPSHVIRIKFMVDEQVRSVSPTLNDMILHRIFELIYYMNFSVHIGIYITFGDKFRHIFKRIYCKCFERHIHEQNNIFIPIKKEVSELEPI